MSKPYFVPKYRSEIENILLKWYPQENKTKFTKMPKKQLYAIYFRRRENLLIK